MTTAAPRLWTLAVAALVLLAGRVATACPNCKQALADNSADLSAAFAASIGFMLAMPFLIFGTLAALAYLSIRRHAARQAANTPVGTVATADGGFRATLAPDPLEPRWTS